MATFENFKEDVISHKGSDGWVTSSTSTNEIYYKLLYSGTAFGSKIVNYPDTDEIKTNLLGLASIVSALVKSFGYAIHINSGYRNHQTNRAAGSHSDNSQHTKGQAVDMSCKDTATKAKLWIFLLNSNTWKNKVDQMIWENNGQWVHCSFKCNNIKKVMDDASYSPRPYSNQDKIYWMPTTDNYKNIWNATYKRTNDKGYVYFVNVVGLGGVQYDGKSFTVDESQLTTAEGSGLSGNIGDYSGGSGGIELVQNYGGSVSRGANKITNLLNARIRESGAEPNVDQDRKKSFEELVAKMIEEAPGLGREVIQSQEMYDPSILKGDQVSKKNIE